MVCFSIVGRRQPEVAAELHTITEYPYASPITIESELAGIVDNARHLPYGKDLMKVVHQMPNLEGLSQSVIHTDLSLDNAILKPDNDLILVDWDDVGVSTTILDLGFPLVHFFVCTENMAFERGRARAFFGTYFKHRRLPEIDRNLIYDAGLLGLLGSYGHSGSPKMLRHIKYVLKNREMITSVIDEHNPNPSFQEDFVGLVDPA